MSNFIFSVNSTIPLFIIIVFGYFLRRIKLFNESFLSVADKYVFKVALPLMLFDDISEMDVRKDFDIKFFLFCVITTIIMFSVPWILSAIFIKERESIGAFVQGCSRSSAAILSIALVQNMYGNVGQVPMMILASVPLFNIFSVIILTVHSSENREIGGAFLKKLFIGIITNPIIIGIILGFPFALLHLQIPTIIGRSLKSVATTATPIALLSIGGAFSIKEGISKIKLATIAAVVKLIILPLVFLPLAIYCGFRNDKLVAIMIMLSSPSTPTGYVMAKNMGNDHVLSSNIIVLTTLFSSLTLTFWIWILKATGNI